MEEKRFVVRVEIANKPLVRDVEGESILRDLVLKSSRNKIDEIRTAKVIRFKIWGKDEEEVTGKVKRICDELRIYNPLVSTCKIDVEGTDKKVD
jgi:phosphoribosylformylglycinamidine synthase